MQQLTSHSRSHLTSHYVIFLYQNVKTVLSVQSIFCITLHWLCTVFELCDKCKGLFPLWLHCATHCQRYVAICRAT